MPQVTSLFGYSIRILGIYNNQSIGQEDTCINTSGTDIQRRHSDGFHIIYIMPKFVIHTVFQAIVVDRYYELQASLASIMNPKYPMLHCI